VKEAVYSKVAGGFNLAVLDQNGKMFKFTGFRESVRAPGLWCGSVGPGHRLPHRSRQARSSQPRGTLHAPSARQWVKDRPTARRAGVLPAPLHQTTPTPHWTPPSLDTPLTPHWTPPSLDTPLTGHPPQLHHRCPAVRPAMRSLPVRSRAPGAAVKKS
jgi:hypothetical protein